MSLVTYSLEGRITAIEPLATCSKDLTDREGGAGKPTPIPHMPTAQGQRLYFPATGIRGTLRRAADNFLRQHLIATTGNKTPRSLDEAYLQRLGGIKGGGEQDRTTVAIIEAWRARNPLLDMFGAGDAGVLGFLEGRAAIGYAVCIDPVEPVIFSGGRTDEFYRSPREVQFLSKEDLESLISRSVGGKQRAQLSAKIKLLEKDAKKLSISDPEKAASIKSEIATLQAKIDSNKEETGASDVSVGMPLAGWKAIPEGSELRHRIRLKLAQPRDLGFLIEAINYWAVGESNKPSTLGAHEGTGCGLVSCYWEVTEVTLQGKRSLGTITMPYLSPVELAGDEVIAARTAFADWLRSGAMDLSIPHGDIEVDHAGA